jgi:hypothetical protein
MSSLVEVSREHIEDLLEKGKYDLVDTDNVFEINSSLFTDINTDWFKRYFIKEGKLVSHPLTRKVLIQFKDHWTPNIVEPLDQLQDIRLLCNNIANITFKGLLEYNKIDMMFSLTENLLQTSAQNTTNPWALLRYFVEYLRHERFLEFMNLYPIPLENRYDFFERCIFRLTHPDRRYFYHIDDWEATVRLILDQLQPIDVIRRARVGRALNYSNYKLIEILYDYGYPAEPLHYYELSKTLREVRMRYYERVSVRHLNRDHLVWREIAGRNYKRLQRYIETALKDLPQRLQEIERMERN